MWNFLKTKEKRKKFLTNIKFEILRGIAPTLIWFITSYEETVKILKGEKKISLSSFIEDIKDTIKILCEVILFEFYELVITLPPWVKRLLRIKE